MENDNGTIPWNPKCAESPKDGSTSDEESASKRRKGKDVLRIELAGSLQEALHHILGVEVRDFFLYPFSVRFLVLL